MAKRFSSLNGARANNSTPHFSQRMECVPSIRRHDRFRQLLFPIIKIDETVAVLVHTRQTRCPAISYHGLEWPACDRTKAFYRVLSRWQPHISRLTDMQLCRERILNDLFIGKTPVVLSATQGGMKPPKVLRWEVIVASVMKVDRVWFVRHHCSLERVVMRCIRTVTYWSQASWKVHIGREAITLSYQHCRPLYMVRKTLFFSKHPRKIKLKMITRQGLRSTPFSASWMQLACGERWFRVPLQTQLLLDVR